MGGSKQALANDLRRESHASLSGGLERGLESVAENGEAERRGATAPRRVGSSKLRDGVRGSLEGQDGRRGQLR